jgi:hypothetical protein
MEKDNRPDSARRPLCRIEAENRGDISRRAEETSGPVAGDLFDGFSSPVVLVKDGGIILQRTVSDRSAGGVLGPRPSVPDNDSHVCPDGHVHRDAPGERLYLREIRPEKEDQI